MKKQKMDNENFLDDLDSKCKNCSNNGTSEHTCPFSEEIHGDDKTMCNCCSNCTHECAMDI